MCIGLPMQIVESAPGTALCEGMGRQRQIDTQLIGEQAPGTWVLVFINSAREVISAERAEEIGAALEALAQAMANPHLTRQNLDPFFSDLCEGEPQKPASLLDLEQRQQSQCSLELKGKLRHE
ncbi:MAG: HypC/HybG/HupF family hydrogenase formation chaperone [Cellvibrionaceae bacterium]|nr:HypC/HybG/HupF family hydrogenase formation chaperone [Cellvibrionaceae bacterium]MCV6625755.1 HypC/HybG/HupF family hydrogenase formation chaperone [Cellvibrionaceae bacterium]